MTIDGTEVERPETAGPGARCPECGAVDGDLLYASYSRGEVTDHVAVKCAECRALLGFFRGTIPGP